MRKKKRKNEGKKEKNERRKEKRSNIKEEEKEDDDPHKEENELKHLSASPLSLVCGSLAKTQLCFASRVVT